MWEVRLFWVVWKLFMIEVCHFWQITQFPIHFWFSINSNTSDEPIWVTSQLNDSYSAGLCIFCLVPKDRLIYFSILLQEIKFTNLNFVWFFTGIFYLSQTIRSVSWVYRLNLSLFIVFIDLTGDYLWAMIFEPIM